MALGPGRTKGYRMPCRSAKTRRPAAGAHPAKRLEERLHGERLFMQGDQFGKLLGAGGAPCGPQIEKEKLP